MQILGKSSPFRITQSGDDIQESFIEVHEGVSFDENLVLIDKISHVMYPTSNYCTSSESTIAERLASGLKLYDIDDLSIADLSTEEDSQHQQSQVNVADPSQILLENLPGVIDRSIVTETSSDKSISCNFLQEETKRRRIAESAVKVLSEALARQTKFITDQTNDLVELRIGCDRTRAVNAELREENFLVNEQNETYESEASDIRVAAQSYQSDCSKMKRMLRQDGELIDQLKAQILEDRQEHQDDMTELRDNSIEQIELLQRNSLRLEEELTQEKQQFRKLMEENEAFNSNSITRQSRSDHQTQTIDVSSKSDHHTQTLDCSKSDFQTQTLTSGSKSDHHTQTLDCSKSDFQTQTLTSGSNSDHHTQTKNTISGAVSSQEERDNDNTEHTLKIEKLNAKLKEQTETHEKIIDRLEKDLRDEVESKLQLSREYERTIRDLESRVVNESTNASRTENDLAVAENRFKEANNDIKYFRQQFIETEQKLQVNQRQLLKVLDEVAMLRHALNHTSNDFGNSQGGIDMSIVSNVDDKLIICESACVSVSNSCENFVSEDRRRRQDGDVTDYTDDETGDGDRSWCYQSGNPYQQQFQQGGFNSNFPTHAFHVSPSDESLSGSVYQQQLPAGVIPIRKTTDPDSNEQKISVVETRRPPPRKQRRKYGKPIDLTPSSSLTNIAISDRPLTSDNSSMNNSRQQHLQQNFNKNIAELDRPSLEKQYAAIRQHRNALIRENSFLKNKCHRVKQDLLFTEKNLQNFSLEAEHKIAMLLMALNNQEYVTTQELNALLQMFPVPSSQQITYPQQQQHNLQQKQQQQQPPLPFMLNNQQPHPSYPMYVEHNQSPNINIATVNANNANNSTTINTTNISNNNNNNAISSSNALLSPYAPEYQPNNGFIPGGCIGEYNEMSSLMAGDPHQLFIQRQQQQDPTSSMNQFFDYQFSPQQQQQQQQLDDPGSYVMSVPSQLPETPVAQDVVDASNQLAAIGVPIAKTF